MLQSAIFLGCMLLFVRTFGQPLVVIDSRPEWRNALDLSQHTVMYEESEAKPESFDFIKAVNFEPYKSSALRYAGRPLIIKWLKIKLKNNTADTLNLLLDINPHYLIRLYDKDGLIAENGISLHNGNADRQSLPINMDPGVNSEYWIRVEERIRYLTPIIIQLETANSYAVRLLQTERNERWLSYLLSTLSGMLLVIMTFGFVQYFLVKETSYFYYGLFAGFALLYSLHSSEERLNLSLFNVDTAGMIWAVVPSGILISYIMFVSRILAIPKNHSLIWKGLQAIMVLSLLQLVMSVWEYYSDTFLLRSNFYYSYLTGVPQMLTAVLVIIVVTKKSAGPLRYFIGAGIGCLVAFYFLPVCIGFTGFHSLPEHIALFVHYGPFWFLVGLTLESVCFSFLLAYRTKLVADENVRLHLEYAKRLEVELDLRSGQLRDHAKKLEKQKIQEMQSVFDYRIAVTEMAALRAQMSPHFIFNCLNSIKLYTLENDSETASEYLSVFAMLIRQVLENSKSEKVTLANELDTLRLYMKLEAMRFKSKLHFRIEHDQNLDIDYLEIPPLLLQPYVENAIWHGLIQKPEGGTIVVGLKMRTENVLSVSITDNGIGRKRAAEIKSKSATRKKSLGTKLTSERITLINQLYHSKTNVETFDLVDDDNQAVGTRVEINIPV